MGVDIRKLCAVLSFVAHIIFVSQGKESLLNPAIIGKELQAFANDALGVDKLQSDFNRFHYEKHILQGKTLTPELSVKLKDKFQQRYAVTQRLKKNVEELYAKPSKPTTAKECCHIKKSTLVYNELFRTKVDLNNFCLKISGTASPNARHLDADKILKVMKGIHANNPFIKWQYFASVEGVHINFPAFDDTAPCTQYDPRYRPFYVETATPKAKDVVLVIDTSASMTGNNLAIAKDAAKTVLDTLNPKDQVNVVVFNTVASTYSGSDVSSCYGNRLAVAVPANKKILKRFIDEHFTGRGGSVYKVGFEKAFDLFKASAVGESDKTKNRVILFLTDGEPTDNDKGLIFKTIRDRNMELNNSVIIFTFGIGTPDSEILTDIAIQNTTKYGYPGNVSIEDITHGQYTAVKDVSTLGTKMASYYNFLPQVKLDRPVVSVPYIDAFGTGLLMSITLPCYNGSGNFIGVTGTDINLEELLSDITFFSQSHATYAFMIRKTGRTLFHPLLPVPARAYDDPFFIDIRTLESDSEFLKVFASMTNGKSGSTTFEATRYLPRGGDIKEGVVVKQINSSYFWSPVESTEFAIGVVIPVLYENEMLSSLKIPKGYSFKYHRIDLDRPQNLCLHFGNIVIMDATVVKFAPGAFKDPYGYIGLNETEVDVKKLHDFMMGKTKRSEYPKLRPGIRDTVIATWNAEKLWLREKTERTQYLVWRYIGTANGVFRATPGAVEQKSYDPRQRPWYYAAVSHSSSLTLTTPYLDMGGAGEVITVARSLYRGESSDNVLGVLGADFPLRYFNRLLAKVYPQCADEMKYTCFIMDQSGFLIMHPDFILPSTKASDVEHVHITQKEKLIAIDLINHGYLKETECRNAKSIQTQSFYEVHLPREGFSTLQKVSCKYELSQITETNVYLGIVVRDSFCVPSSCSCSSDNKCSLLSGLKCECPCTSSLEFLYCRNQFPNSSLPLCPTFAPSGYPDTDAPKSETICINKCFDPRCQTRNSSQWCDGIVSCYWCEKDQNGSPLTKPYCASSERCFRGKESATKRKEQCIRRTIPQLNTKQPATTTGTGLSAAAVVGIALGCSIPVVLLAIGLAIWVMKRYRHSANPPVKKGNSASVQRIVSRAGISDVPDVLPTPPYYDNPDDINVSQESLNADGQLQRQNAGDVVYSKLNFVNVGQSYLPENQRKFSTRSDQAPPVPNKKRPSDVSPRRPSQCGTTAPNMYPFRSMSADSPIQPQVGLSGRDHPPAVVPRARRSPNDSFSESRPDVPSTRSVACPKSGLYSNIPPISESREDLINDNNEDDVDVDGHVKCVCSREDTQFV